MRGRPKTFDRDEALFAALELFWEKGYSATAIGDLTERMGIGRQSLYNTFGDKHDLYLEALRRYVEMRMSMAREIFESDGAPLDNLSAFFAMVREEAVARTSGCMMVNCSTEVGAVDDAAARLVEKAHLRLENMLRDLFERAHEAGDLTDLASPRALARLIIDTLNGIAARSRLGLDAEEVDEAVATLEAIVRAPARRAA